MPYVVINDIIIADVCYHSFVMVTCTLYVLHPDCILILCRYLCIYIFVLYYYKKKHTFVFYIHFLFCLFSYKINI
jgi:hypothetical protein